MRQRSLFSLFGIDLLSLVLILCLYSCSVKINKPNILFIMLDNHSATALGSFGTYLSSIYPTTVLDKLVPDGISFNNCLVTKICTSCQACIITGLRNDLKIIRIAPGDTDKGYPEIEYLINLQP